MPREAKAKVALPIGLSDVYFAKLTTDTIGAVPTYESPVYLSRAIKATLTPVTKAGTLDSEDETEIDETEIVGYTVSIEASQLDNTARALLGGHKVDDDGGLIITTKDISPEGALLFKSKLSDKINSKYVVLYKGSFGGLTEEFETDKKDGKTYKTHTVEGNFRARTSDGVIQYSIRSDSENASAEKIAAWFTKVQEPGEVSA